MHAIQQARIDFPFTYIIAVASSQHHERLGKLGAHRTFDYKSSSLVRDVQNLGRDIRKGLDCHSEGGSTVLAAECMVPGENATVDGTYGERRVIRTLPPGMMSGTLPAGVRASEWILSYTALGKVCSPSIISRQISNNRKLQPFWFLFKYYPAVLSDYKTASTYLKNLTGLLMDGKVVPVKHRLMPGGLANISQGFDEMRSGRVRGEKLVYKIGPTWIGLPELRRSVASSVLRKSEVVLESLRRTPEGCDAEARALKYMTEIDGTNNTKQPYNLTDWGRRSLPIMRQGGIGIWPYRLCWLLYAYPLGDIMIDRPGQTCTAQRWATSFSPLSPLIIASTHLDRHDSWYIRSSTDVIKSWWYAQTNTSGLPHGSEIMGTIDEASKHLFTLYSLEGYKSTDMFATLDL